MNNKLIQLRGKERLTQLPLHICFMLSSEDFKSSSKRICDIVQWAISFSTDINVLGLPGIQKITFHLHSITNADEVVSELSCITEFAPCAWYTAEGRVLPYEIGIKVDSRSYHSSAPEIIVVAGVSGRQEIADTLEILARKGIKSQELTEQVLAENLRFPDCPDLVIKTRERNLVDFMIWQTAYSELYFTQAPLAAFTQHEFNCALLDYQSRTRKFGK
ncbi:MAG: undecaprenyl diphosphate synthase family protein [Methanomicrobiales archaeon]|jgi:undecaprenyl pyrophosphate synthase|nr:undecaprenyl diphosphate synthase family protein [Methanomicrobiales archaeon]